MMLENETARNLKLIDYDHWSNLKRRRMDHCRNYGSVHVSSQIHDSGGDITSRTRKDYHYIASAVFLFVMVLWVGYSTKPSSLDQTTITVSSAPSVPVPTSLPLGWEVRYTSSGTPFYYDAINDVSSFTPPGPVGYPTVLTSPLFTQPPSMLPPTALVKNSPLHKWGQFGMGPVPYNPYPPPWPSAVVLDGGIAPFGSSFNTSMAFWNYKNFNTVPLGSTARTAAAFLDYKRSNNAAFIAQSNPTATVISSPSNMVTQYIPNAQNAVNIQSNVQSAAVVPCVITSGVSCSGQGSAAAGSVSKEQTNSKDHVYTVYVPRFCSSTSSSPLCSCSLMGMATRKGCSPAQPVAIRNNVEQGQWLTSSSFTKPDGSSWSSFYRLDKDGGVWHWATNSTGEFFLDGARPKRRVAAAAPKAAAKKKQGPLTKCPKGTYLGVSGNCISKTKCDDGTYCVKGRIGAPAPES